MPELQYAICAVPRSGSGLLCDALHSTGVAGAPAEWFSRGLTHHHLSRWGLAAPESTATHPMALPRADYLARVRQAAEHRGVLAVKVHQHQLAWYRGLPGAGGDLFDLFDGGAHELPVIALHRRDLVAQAVSSLIAEATRTYSRDAAQTGPSFELADLPAREPVYDFPDLLARVIHFLEAEHAWEEFFTRHRIRPHRLAYEDLVADPPAAVRAALDHLGADTASAAPVRTTLLRQATPLNAEFATRFRTDLTAAAPSLSPTLRARLT